MSAANSPLSKSFEPSYEASYGLGLKLLSIALILFGLFMFWLVPSAGINECREEDQRWIAASMGGFFTIMGVWNGITAFFAKIRWNEQTVEYPDFIGRKTYALWSEIDDIGETSWFQLEYVKFVDKPALFFTSYAKNSDAFKNKIINSLKPTRPYRFYVPASRDAVQLSKVCGCMVCDGIYPKASILNWTRYFSKEDSDRDVAICPNCKQDMGVVCDLSEFELTKHGLKAVFETVCKEWSSADHMTRTNLRTQFCKI